METYGKEYGIERVNFTILVIKLINKYRIIYEKYVLISLY